MTGGGCPPHHQLGQPSLGRKREVGKLWARNVMHACGHLVLVLSLGARQLLITKHGS